MTPRRGIASMRKGRELSSRSKRYARVESVLEESGDDEEYPDEPEPELEAVTAWETRRDNKKSKADSRESRDAREASSVQAEWERRNAQGMWGKDASKLGVGLD